MACGSLERESLACQGPSRVNHRREREVQKTLLLCEKGSMVWVRADTAEETHWNFAEH